MTEPRVRLIPPEEWDPDLRAFVTRASVVEGEPLNFFHAMAWHPAVLTRWTRFTGQLLGRGRLPARDRELLILRTVWNCGAEYEWVHHCRLAGDNGIRADEISALRQGPDAPGWQTSESLLLRAADELHAGSQISDQTWRGLAAQYDEADLLEIVLLVGNYHLVSYFVRSFGVPLEAGVTRDPWYE